MGFCVTGVSLTGVERERERAYVCVCVGEKKVERKKGVGKRGTTTKPLDLGIVVVIVGPA